MIRNKSRWTRALALGVGLALVSAACGSDSSESSDAANSVEDSPDSSDGGDTDAGTDDGDGSDQDTSGDDGGSDPSGDPVVIGFLNGQSGDYADWGPPALVGHQVAIDEINAAGGINGRPVELAIQDTQTTAQGAVAGLSTLIEVNGAHVVSGFESYAALAIIDTLAENQVVGMCSPCGTTELDELGGDWVFRPTASDSDIGLVAAQQARDRGFTRVAILASQSEDTLSSARRFKEVFEANDLGEIIADVRFNPGGSGYQSEIQEAFDGNPDAVYLAAAPTEGAIIVREWERRDYGGVFLVSPDLILDEFAGLTEALEGNAFAALAAYDEDTPAYISFAERYTPLSGDYGEPDEGWYDANNYDSVILLALAIVAAGGTDDPVAIRDAIFDIAGPPGTVVYSFAEGVAALANGEEIDYHGASGSLDFNEFGNLSSPKMVEQEIIDGEWVSTNAIDIDESLR